MGTMGEDIRNTATRKMAGVILNFTVITLYVNVINNLKWIKKHDTILSLSVKYILEIQDRDWLKRKTIKRLCHTNNNQKKVGVCVLVSE